MTDSPAASVAVRLQAEQLHAGARVVLSQVDLELGAHRVHAIVGPNGSGKSTLLRAIAGDRIDGVERLEWFGHDARAMSAPRQARLRAAVLNEPIPPFGLTSAEFVGLGVLEPADAVTVWQRAMDALKQCGAAHLAERSVDVLSAGELARVRLAQALATDSPLLVLDEPDAALDPDSRAELHELMRGWGATVVVVSHDASAVRNFADTVHRVEGGRVARVKD